MKTYIVSLILLTAFAFVGCGTEDGSPNDDGGDMSTAMDAGGDDAASTSDSGEPQPQGAFEIGTNPVGEANPENFNPISAGTEVPVVWGVQGSWMVVLAFRSQEMFEDALFDVRADITIDGEEKGEIWLEGQETFPGGDGWSYYYSLFLALDIDGDAPAQGTPAHIRMSVTDEDGTMAEQEYDVVIGEAVGGPP